MKPPIIGGGGAGPVITGIAWYPDEAEYRRALESFPDAAEMHDTYAEWKRSAEKAETSVRSSGIVVERIPIRVDAVLRWAARHGRPADSSARSEYVVREVELRAKIRHRGQD